MHSLNTCERDKSKWIQPTRRTRWQSRKEIKWKHQTKASICNLCISLFLKVQTLFLPQRELVILLLLREYCFGFACFWFQFMLLLMHKLLKFLITCHQIRQSEFPISAVNLYKSNAPIVVHTLKQESEQLLAWSRGFALQQ